MNATHTHTHTSGHSAAVEGRETDSTTILRLECFRDDRKLIDLLLQSLGRSAREIFITESFLETILWPGESTSLCDLLITLLFPEDRGDILTSSTRILGIDPLSREGIGGEREIGMRCIQVRSVPQEKVR